MSATIDRPQAAVTQESPQQRAERGRTARAEVPRGSHAAWSPGAERRDPVAVLEAQAAERVPELVPVRYGRMLASPFAFFRGAAAIMAGDLAGTPRSGMHVQACGDAHLSNFGGFGSPERELVFDINDFDETLRGPWEWDVKRLAASVEIAARENGCKASQRQKAVLSTVRAYREAIREFASMRNLDVWYAKVDAARLREAVGQTLGAKATKRLDRRTAKALAKDNLRALEKLTHLVDGEPRIVSDPPLIVPIAELLPGAPGDALRDEVGNLIETYRTSLRSDRRRLVESYRYTDLARKVVGVGSVGTRAWIVLMLGRDGRDPLLLQVKEATASVLEPFLGDAPEENHGQRVVEGQWMMQSASDILLGWLRATGIDGQVRDFYVRQLWDWKVSAEVETMTPALLALYGELCGRTLARAHARSGDRIAIAAYLGSGDAFDRALGEFADAYADQSERDFAALGRAADSGAVAVSALA
jgi:uncharacterized protein (DUF2252 family)